MSHELQIQSLFERPVFGVKEACQRHPYDSSAAFAAIEGGENRSRNPIGKSGRACISSTSLAMEFSDFKKSPSQIPLYWTFREYAWVKSPHWYELKSDSTRLETFSRFSRILALKMVSAVKNTICVSRIISAFPDWGACSRY